MLASSFFVTKVLTVKYIDSSKTPISRRIKRPSLKRILGFHLGKLEGILSNLGILMGYSVISQKI